MSSPFNTTAPALFSGSVLSSRLSAETVTLLLFNCDFQGDVKLAGFTGDDFNFGSFRHRKAGVDRANVYLPGARPLMV